jgi:hypothetical protein
MPEYIEVVETYWSVCWKWIFPYPCKKHRTVKKWHYHFDFLVVSYRYVYSNYWGCELGLKYQWRKWELNGSGEDFVLYDYDMYFDSKKSDAGGCPGLPGGGDPGPIL